MKSKEIEIEGEKVYLKKDSMGWRVINPTKIDGKTNYCNLILGGKRNILTLIVLLLIVASFLLAYGELSKQCNDMIENPCDYSYFQNFSECRNSVLGGVKSGASNQLVYP